MIFCRRRLIYGNWEDLRYRSGRFLIYRCGFKKITRSRFSFSFSYFYWDRLTNRLPALDTPCYGRLGFFPKENLIYRECQMRLKTNEKRATPVAPPNPTGGNQHVCLARLRFCINPTLAHVNVSIVVRVSYSHTIHSYRYARHLEIDTNGHIDSR